MNSTSDALHKRARAFVTAFETGASAPETFDELACDIARFQASRVAGFRRLGEARRTDFSAVKDANDIPAVPTDAFKVSRVATFEADVSSVTFRTSGTTVGTRGEHSMRDVSTYNAAAVAFGRHWLVRDINDPIPVVVLGPSPDVQSDSSLGHMCKTFVHAFGTSAAAKQTYLIDENGVIDLAAFDERVAAALAQRQPMLVLGTSFAFVHLMDALGQNSFHLPPGSRVMQTGGYKGRSRVVPADVLRRDLCRVFALEPRAIISEYGMTELSSQFYERSGFDPNCELGVYAEPPWARVVPVNPETLDAVPDGTVGIAKIIDLMNIDSAVAILTQDLVRRVDGGFVLLGRASDAPPRGCSIAMDELLGRQGSSVVS